ncbi:unnamed protein product [Lepeophtheirus salmonis]|uniref:(salmon louse) hypothetical protein n=1 Tax=Lepeophtheirus salmonis TaxID=72036 RepID=A0A7R8CTU9_LEPSM|nr:unnamed protein product [Lepeophtheirus salmonis]CAF2929407.1 unnamed protein product [Lepeophtheirus salmonis]
MLKMQKKVLKSTGGSTTGLFVHIKSVHNITETDLKTESEIIKKQKTLTSFRTSNPKSIEEEIVQLAVFDGFSFNCIANSVRFSATLDEYTSSGENVKLMNINLHHKDKYWLLGLIKVQGGLDSIKFISDIKKRLAVFGLDFDKHIVGCTIDGVASSIAAKYWKEILPVHQQCLAHTMHQAITAVLYEKKLEKDDIDREIRKDSRSTLIVGLKNEELDALEDGYASLTSDENEDEEELKSPFSNILQLGVQNTREVHLLKDDFLSIINKVRRICRIFRKSPLKNERLQDFVKEEFHGKEIKLVLDSNTRWNSLISMIERFLKLKQCIPKALQVINSAEIISTKEWEVLEEMIDVLRPFEIALKGLCSRDANLLTETEDLFRRHGAGFS